MHTKSKKEYDLYWQAIRGLAILAVVLIHCKSNIQWPIISFGGGYYLLVRNLINFPVALFFFISGYFCNVPDDNMQSITWLKRRLARLLIPYTLFSVTYYFIYSFMGVHRSAPRLLLDFLIGGMATPLYFIVVESILTCLSPLICHTIDKEKFKAIALGSIATIIVGYLVQLSGISIWKWMKYSPICLSFYVGGILIRKYAIKINLQKIKFIFPIVLAIELVESIIELASSNMKIIAFSQFKLSGILYSSIVCLVIYAGKRNVTERNVLVKIGECSYPIFYLHYVFIIIFNSISNNYFERVPFPILQLFEGVMVTILSMALWMMIKRFVPHKLIKVCGLL